MGSADELILEFYRRLDSGDVDSAVALWAPSCEYERAGVGTLRGKAEVARFYRERSGGARGRHTIVSLLSSESIAGVEGIFETGAEPLARQRRLFSDWFRWDTSGIFWRRTYHFVTPQWAGDSVERVRLGEVGY